MELIIEHLKGYLGTGLKVQINKKTYPSWIGVKELTLETLFTYRGQRNTIKPLLYPLSKLTKEEKLKLQCLHNDKEINSLADLSFFYGDSTNLEEIKAVFEYLYTNHFDIHGLIEQGLAIDINTLIK